MLDHSWIESMQYELNQFKRLDVWELVPLPDGRHAIKVKWLWKKKTDVENMVIRNKFHLAAKDVDLAGCLDDYKSTSRETAEAEYVSLSVCCAQVIWMRTQLLDYGYRYNKILIYCNSKSAIAITCNPVQHSHTKHINIRYHFIKEHVVKGTIKLYFVEMEYQLSDLFTKALPRERFEYLVHRIGMRCMTPTQLERLV
ncbi:hypothetical protein Tco_1547015 [Tanacetum coccineum]